MAQATSSENRPPAFNDGNVTPSAMVQDVPADVPWNGHQYPDEAANPLWTTWPSRMIENGRAGFELPLSSRSSSYNTARGVTNARTEESSPVMASSYRVPEDTLYVLHNLAACPASCYGYTGMADNESTGASPEAFLRLYADGAVTSTSHVVTEELSSTSRNNVTIPAGTWSVQHGPGDGPTSSYGSEQPAIAGSSCFTIPPYCSGGFYSIATTSSAVLEDTMRPHDTGIPAGTWSVQHGPGDGPTSSYGSEQPAITGSSRFTIPSSCSGGFYSIASTSSALFEDTMRPHDTGHPEGITETSNQEHGSEAVEEPRNAYTFYEEAFRCAEDLKKLTGENVNKRKHVCRECSKCFPCNAELKRHYRTHTGEKPYTCEVCHQKFAQKGHITQHLLKHTGEQPFRCDHCGAKFKRKAEMTKHINKKH